MPWIQNYRRIGLYFYAYCSYTEAVNKIRRWISMTNWKGWWRKAYVLVQRNYIHRIPVILHENLQCESHKPYCPRNSVSHCSRYVTREMPVPQALRLQTHTHLCAHDFAHSIDVWHQPRLAKVTCTWSWRHCGITPPKIFWILSR